MKNHEKSFDIKKLKDDLGSYWAGEHTRECEIAAYGVCSCPAGTTFGCGCPIDKIRPNCKDDWMHHDT